MELRTAGATAKTPATQFTGDMYLNSLFSGDGASRLVVGLVGTRDGTTGVLRAGESVWNPAEEDHWGGTAENLMCHYAMLDGCGDTAATTWLEPVTGDQCTAAHAAVGIPAGQER